MLTGLLAAFVALGGAAGFAWWRHRRDGLLKPTARASVVISTADIGQPYGERATLIQFSSAFCQPCRATRRILTDVAEMIDGVAYVEIDAESRLDLVRKLGIMRTPTVLILDAHGVIVRRATGQPRKPDVIAAVGDAVQSARSA